MKKTKSKSSIAEVPFGLPEAYQLPTSLMLV
jgi:hypothetical protein